MGKNYVYESRLMYIIDFIISSATSNRRRLPEVKIIHSLTVQQSH